MLRISTSEGYLKLKPNIEIPITLTSPLFNDRGSFSLPFSIPIKPNRVSLGSPEDVNEKLPVDKLVDVTIEHSGLNEKGTLQVVDIKNGLAEVTLTTREGAFWEWAKSTKMRDIETLDNREIDFVNERENYFNNIWPDVEMAFFPIAVNLISLENYVPEGGEDNGWASRKLCISDYILTNNPGDLFRDDYADFEGGGDVSGYITGFLYINEVIQWIANTYGLRVNTNYLASTTELKSAVVLNNATFSNMLTSSYQSVNYPYLLPDVNVIDFIDALEKKFGCRFFIDPAKREINIKSIKDILTETDHPELNGKLTLTKPFDSYGFKISSGRVDSPYITINENYINNLFFIYDTEYESRIDGKIYATAASPDYETYPNKNVFCIASQCFFQLEWVENGANYDYTATAIHSSYYDLSNNDTLEQKEISCNGKLVPMIPVTCRQFYNYPDNDYFDITLTVPHFEKWDSLMELLTGEETETPISFAFYRGRIKHVDFPEELFGITDFDLPIGTSDIYDDEGNVITGATLAMRIDGDNGIYETFYKELEQFYLKSGKEVSVTNVKPIDIAGIDMSKVYSVNGVNILFNEIKITLTATGLKFDSATAFTVKVYD